MRYRKARNEMAKSSTSFFFKSLFMVSVAYA